MAENFLRKQDYLAARDAHLAVVAERSRQGRLLREQYQALQAEYRPLIESLQTQADHAAREFKRLFQEASLAYAGEMKAMAKSLSLEGKAEQARCEGLNNQVNAMRSRLKELQEGHITAFEFAKTAQLSAAEADEKAKTARTTKVEVAGSGLLSNEAVEKMLDAFPQSVASQITSVRFDSNLADPFGTPARGTTFWNRNGHGSIVIGSQPQSSGKKAELSARDTVAHEIGHVIYQNFTPDEVKADWFALHSQTTIEKFIRSHTSFENEEEDFAECIRLFMLDDEALREHDKSKYKLIHDIFRTL